MHKIKVGQIVRLLHGREAGKYVIVTKVDSPQRIWVADGRTRFVDKPKKKNIKHIQPTNVVDSTVLEVLRKQKVLTDADIRSALNHYFRIREGHQKGE